MVIGKDGVSVGGDPLDFSHISTVSAPHSMLKYNDPLSRRRSVIIEISLQTGALLGNEGIGLASKPLEILC